MYLIRKKKIKGKYLEEIELDGFNMGKKNKVFNIGDYKVSNIVIYSKILGEKVVSSKVMKKYDKLIKYLTELLVSDDDTGDAMREALNQIEKFRLEIKIKYRKFLKRNN